MRTESYSSLNTFKTCRYKYYSRYVLGREEEPTAAMLHGRDAHDLVHRKKRGAGPEIDYALEVMGKTRKTVYKSPLGIIKVFDNSPVIELQEEKFGLTGNFEPTDFEGPDAIFRGVVDYARVEIDKDVFRRSVSTGHREFYLDDLVKSVYLVDWKTGSSKATHRQLNWYAVYFHRLFGDLDEVTCQNVYLTSQKKSPKWVVRRGDVRRLMEEITASIENVREAHRSGEWSPCPSGLCGYCSFRAECHAKHGIGQTMTLSNEIPSFLGEARAK